MFLCELLHCVQKIMRDPMIYHLKESPVLTSIFYFLQCCCPFFSVEHLHVNHWESLHLSIILYFSLTLQSS
uniref:Putative ovule protein n=1 Tax=Solanum chacoense TaxID=4108 RepID=A0A0V0GHL0_SOLCH